MEEILNRIKSDCDESVRAIELEAENKRSEAMSEAKKQAELVCEEISEKSKAKLAQIKASSKSRAELEVRNALLKRRRQEIDITTKKLMEHIIALDDNAYFEAIYKLAEKLDGSEGELYLNRRDLKRLPSDFEQRIKAAGLNAVVAKEAANISGGFILKHGDIEENMDFAALISAKRDEIEDLINRELFAQ